MIDKKIKKLILDFFQVQNHRISYYSFSKTSLDTENMKIWHIDVSKEPYSTYRGYKLNFFIMLGEEILRYEEKVKLEDFELIKIEDLVYTELVHGSRRGQKYIGESPDGYRSGGYINANIPYVEPRPSNVKLHYYKLPEKVTEQWWNPLVANSVVVVKVNE